MTAFIDPPDPWDSLKTWRAYRRDLDALPLEDDGIVQQAIIDADRQIAELEAREASRLNER